MAWLTDVGAGGGTSYLIPGKQSPIVHRFLLKIAFCRFELHRHP